MIMVSLQKITRIGAGYKSYLVAATVLLFVLVERGLGFDVPGLMLEDDWLSHVLAALGLVGLRAAINPDVSQK